MLAGLLRPLVDQDLAMVFYDMTTIRAKGLSQQDDDTRKFGMSKEGMVARQIMLGMVQTVDGLPRYHEVFDGDTDELTTIKPTIEKIVKRFPAKRVIAVADRGLLSTDNLTDLQTFSLPGGRTLEFIWQFQGGAIVTSWTSLAPFQATQCIDAKQEVLGEAVWNNLSRP